MLPTVNSRKNKGIEGNYKRPLFKVLTPCNFKTMHFRSHVYRIFFYIITNECLKPFKTIFKTLGCISTDFSNLAELTEIS